MIQFFSDPAWIWWYFVFAYCNRMTDEACSSKLGHDQGRRNTTDESDPYRLSCARNVCVLDVCVCYKIPSKCYGVMLWAAFVDLGAKCLVVLDDLTWTKQLEFLLFLHEFKLSVRHSCHTILDSGQIVLPRVEQRMQLLPLSLTECPVHRAGNVHLARLLIHACAHQFGLENCVNWKTKI